MEPASVGHYLNAPEEEEGEERGEERGGGERRVYWTAGVSGGALNTDGLG